MTFMVTTVSCKQVKDYKISIYCFSAKFTTGRSETKDQLASIMSSMKQISPSSCKKVTCSHHDKIYSGNIADLALNNNHSITLT
jgi:hypothetical protein